MSKRPEGRGSLGQPNVHGSNTSCLKGCEERVSPKEVNGWCSQNRGSHGKKPLERQGRSGAVAAVFICSGYGESVPLLESHGDIRW